MQQKMRTKNKISSIPVFVFLTTILVTILYSCVTTPKPKVLEERDPIVKKLEEKDSIRIVKPARHLKNKKEQATNNN